MSEEMGVPEEPNEPGGRVGDYPVLRGVDYVRGGRG